MIPIASPIIEDEEIKNVIDVMKSGFIAQGPRVEEFERKFSAYIGSDYAIAVNSGTAALHVALLSLGIGRGDEVITTPFTFAATGNAILYTGATPVFVDIDLDTYTLDPANIEAAITNKTKAIMPVQLYGQTADMGLITQIAKENDLKVIEDAAQAHGAMYKNEKAGAIGDVGCFSFYPTKNMTTSEGGMITTDDIEVATLARGIRAHGEQKGRYQHSILGYNFRMTDISAAIGLAQLEKLDKFNQKRIENADYLDEHIRDIDGIVGPTVREDCKHVFHQYTIRVESASRDEFQKYLTENGVSTGIHYPIPLYKQELYKERGITGNCPIAENTANQVLSIPVHPSLNADDLGKIVQVLEDAAYKLG